MQIALKKKKNPLLLFFFCEIAIMFNNFSHLMTPVETHCKIASYMPGRHHLKS